jgi:Tol biopolymer transport system component
LYVKNLLTGEDKLIVKNANGFEEFDNLSFSPDGTRIMFHACPPVGAGCDSPTVDTVNIDGSDLKIIADSYYDDTSDTDYRPESPVYSPDGSEVLMELLGVHEGTSEDGEPPVPPSITRYVGLVTAAGERQAARRLVEGKPLFWSTDGRSIYYDGKSGLARIDVGIEDECFREGAWPLRVPSGQGAWDRCSLRVECGGPGN